MAIVQKSQSVPNPGFRDWVVNSDADTETGKITLTVFGASGRANNSGSAAYLIKFYEEIASEEPQDAAFYQSLVSAIKSLQASAQQIVGSNTSTANHDSAARQITQTDTVPPQDGTEVTSEESARAGDSPLPESEPLIEPAAGNKSEVGADYVDPRQKSTDSLTAPTVNVLPDKVFNPLLNPLHAYASYTYNLSWHLLTEGDYMQIVENQEFRPNRVLVASAGRYNNTLGQNQFIRAPRFKEDFYFENFNLLSVIMPSEGHRNTNSVQLEFSVVEPYGFTLIERLYKTNRDLNSKNYLDVPYAIQIDFFGINDAGEIVGIIPGQTKIFAIKLVNLSATVTGAGATYSITAVPFNHSAHTQIYGSTPTNFEIKGTTVASFFQSAESLDSGAAAEQDREISRAVLSTTVGTNQNRNGAISGRTVLSAENLDPIKVHSYGAAINSWCQKLKELNKIGVADIYKFEFAPEIANAKFVFPNLSNHLDSGMVNTDDPNSVSIHTKGNLGSAAGTYDKTKQIFVINAGTTIDRVIDYIVRNSSYVLDQIVIPEDFIGKPEDYKKALADNNGALNWWKIIPKIKYRDEFDTIRGVYAREITYTVVPYRVKNLPLDVAPRGIENSPTKVYDYIYTGQNKDVINFELKFNMMYYNAPTAYRGNLTEVHPVPNALENNKQQNVDSYQGSEIESDPNEPVPGEAVMPLVLHPRVLDARGRATGGSIYAKQVAASEIESFILSNVEGEMIVVELEIVGDPQFLKQDDIFYPVDLSTNESDSDDPRLTKNGSIRTDNGIIYINLNFRTPIDVDERTGLMEFESANLTSSAFSGLYMLHSVRSSFTQGKFTQVLMLVRAYRQGEDLYNNAKKENQERKVDGSPGQIDLAPAVQQDAGVPPVSLAVDPEEGGSPTAASPDLDPFPIDDESERQNLAQVADSAPTSTITDSNEPASSVPPSTNVNDPNNLINSIQDNTLKKLSSSDPKVKLEAVEDSADKYRRLQTIYENQGDFERARIARQQVEIQLSERARLRQQLGL